MFTRTGKCFPNKYVKLSKRRKTHFIQHTFIPNNLGLFYSTKELILESIKSPLELKLHQLL